MVCYNGKNEHRCVGPGEYSLVFAGGNLGVEIYRFGETHSAHKTT